MAPTLKVRIAPISTPSEVAKAFQDNEPTQEEINEWFDKHYGPGSAA